MGGRRSTETYSSWKVTRMKQRKKGDMSNKRMHMCVYRQSATFKNESKLCFCVCKPTQVLTFLDVNVEFKKGKRRFKMCQDCGLPHISAPVVFQSILYSIRDTSYPSDHSQHRPLVDMYTCIQISRKIPQVLRIRKVNTQEFCF